MNNTQVPISDIVNTNFYENILHQISVRINLSKDKQPTHNESSILFVLSASYDFPFKR